MRKLKEKYGSRFLGGVANSRLSMDIAPDLILERKFTKRSNYLKIMRQSDICIGTVGLHKSTGGKMGEYVAASRAIVCEKIYYDVPGNFAPGRNYLVFDGADSCLRNVQELMRNPDRIYQMQCDNRDYYRNWLEPEQLVRNSLKTAGVEN